jgi:hypothetical protein
LAEQFTTLAEHLIAHVIGALEDRKPEQHSGGGACTVTPSRSTASPS